MEVPDGALVAVVGYVVQENPLYSLPFYVCVVVCRYSISMEVPDGALVAVVGSMGSGNLLYSPPFYMYVCCCLPLQY